MAYTTINKSSDYFNTKLYTGNGSAGHAITGVGFQPDWVWYKGRNDTEDPKIFDAVRGVTKAIKPNGTDAEFTQSGVTSFNSDGFTLGSHTGGNENNINFASWNWKANGAGSANTAGSINSTVSVNTTSGFSIVKYTGTGAIATVGHGLGVAPKMIIAKGLGVVNNWLVYHHTLGNNKALALQDTSTGFTGSHLWNDTNPTSSVFSLGAVNATNSSGDENIAYCFAEKTGYSKFGSFTGNGNADGPFIYTGFKPAFVIVKITSTSNNWNMFDDKRPGFNEITLRLFPNLSNAEQDGSAAVDFVSNGFKFRNTNDNYNASGASYIYMAFGQSLVGTNGVTAKAR